jgi:AraC-like DNA-binding protein
MTIMAESVSTDGLAGPPWSNGRTGAARCGRDIECRVRILNLSIGLVENLSSDGAPGQRSGEEFSAQFQVCLPYRGLFVWHVGRHDVVGDANQVLFVTGGESYRLSRPLSGGYGELIVTPDVGALSELAHTTRARLSGHPLFARRCFRANPRLQSFRARFLHWATTSASEADDLEAEERVLTLLRAALRDDGGRCAACGPTTARLIRRTKEFLEAQLSSPIRLMDVGNAVGASPAYLTDVFRRIEGIPLHRYLTQSRLARALVELPHAADLTALALEVGFSSHSHFSAAFRRAFGCTPSRFRETTRPRARPSTVFTPAALNRRDPWGSGRR